MEDIWLRVAATFVGQLFLEERGRRDTHPSMLAKYASVALLGVWAIRKHYRFRLETTSCDQDCRSQSVAYSSATPGSPQENGVSIFRDIVTRQQVLGLTSMRPVHQMCLEQERLQIARARLIILQHADPKWLLSLRVDEVFCRIARNRQEKFVAQVESITYRDLASVLPLYRRVIYRRTSSSRTQVYRVKFAERAQYPGGQLTTLREAEAPISPPLEWQVFETPLRVQTTSRSESSIAWLPAAQGAAWARPAPERV